jgi:transcriptional antiterminator Rof (Rho-off)
MRFHRESDMAKPVRHWLRRQRLLVKEEFGLPWGICDIVALSFDENQLAKRLSFRQFRPIGPLHRVELLQHIPDQESGSAITVSRLQKSASRTAFSPPIEDDLQILIANRFVVSMKNGSLQKLNGWVPLHERIIAVELKLSRVSEALAQAVSNRAFATESYIALPVEVAERLTASDRILEFTKAGVGVLALTKTTCRVFLPASQRQISPDVILQMHCVERFWRTRGNSSSIAGPHVQAS